MIDRVSRISRACPSAGRFPVPLLVALLTSTLLGQEATTIDRVRDDVAKGEYSAAVQKANKLLFSSSLEAMPAQKYELLMLRGEAQLQLKERVGASSSFKSASKFAGDVNQLAAARANAL